MPSDGAVNSKEAAAGTSEMPDGETDTDETLANALRKLISHRFHQKIEKSRSNPPSGEVSRDASRDVSRNPSRTTSNGSMPTGEKRLSVPKDNNETVLKSTNRKGFFL